MISWRKRSPKTAGPVCLDIHSDGVAVCHLEGIQQDRPRFTWCGYWPHGAAGGSTREIGREIRARRLVNAPCVAVLSPDHYILRLVDAPDVHPSELAEAARWLVKDLTDFAVEDAVVDFFEIPQEQRSDRGRLIYVVAAQAEAVQDVVGLAVECGLRLQSIGVRELALADLSRRLATGVDGAALLQVDRKHSLIVTVQNETLHLVRRLEARLGDLVTENGAFEKEGPIFEPQVRELDSDPRLVANEDSENYDALLLELQRSLDYHETHLAQSAVTNLWCAPLEEDVPELLPLLEKHLTVGVRSLDLNELLDSNESLPEPDQARCVAGIGAGLGMASAP